MTAQSLLSFAEISLRMTVRLPRFRGVVFENNVSRNSVCGIEVGDGVSAVVRNHKFENVDMEYDDGGADLTIID